MQRLHVVALGGAGGAADAVTTGASAQQNHHISGGGDFPAHVGGGGSGNHSAAFQPLGNIALVVQFSHVTGGKANLVAIGGVAGSSGGCKLPLGELALDGILQADPGIAAAGDAHGLVHIGTS